VIDEVEMNHRRNLPSRPNCRKTGIGNFYTRKIVRFPTTWEQLMDGKAPADQVWRRQPNEIIMPERYRQAMNTRTERKLALQSTKYYGKKVQV